MRILVKNFSLLLSFYIIIIFNACNAMSANVESFYRIASKGKTIPIAICKNATIEILESISALTQKRKSLEEPTKVVSGIDEDCPMTAEEEIDGVIAGSVGILESIDKALKGRETEGDEVTALQQQLVEVFKVYSECDSDGFQKSCHDALVKLKP